MENATFKQIANVIKNNRTFSIYMHVHTDIDAIGSALALRKIIKSMGKTAHIFVDSTFPSNTQCFEDIDVINNEKLSVYDVCIILDCNDDARLGRFKYKYRKNVKTSILIDHHLDNTRVAKYNYVRTDVSSTCELIYNFAKYINYDLDVEICRLLISGILTDTGSLKFSNTYPSSLKAVADMLAISGLKMDEISMQIFNNLTYSAFELRKLAMNRLQLFFDSKFGMIDIRSEDFHNLGVAFDETKGLTDIAMQLASVKIVALVSESDIEEGTYYISFRSKDNYNAKRIAEDFGGGGHLKASGCKIVDHYDTVLDLIKTAVKKELDRVNL